MRERMLLLMPKSKRLDKIEIPITRKYRREKFSIPQFLPLIYHQNFVRWNRQFSCTYFISTEQQYLFECVGSSKNSPNDDQNYIRMGKSMTKTGIPLRKHPSTITWRHHPFSMSFLWDQMKFHLWDSENLFTWKQRDHCSLSSFEKK